MATNEMIEINIYNYLTDNFDNTNANQVLAIAHISDLLFEYQVNVSRQMFTTILSADKNDYFGLMFKIFSNETIKSALNANNDPDEVEFDYTQFIDVKSYSRDVLIYFIELFKKYLNVEIYYDLDNFDLLSAVGRIYRVYLMFVKSQKGLSDFLIDIFYKIDSKHISELMDVLNKDVRKDSKVTLPRRIKIKSNNYIFELSKIIETKEDLLKIAKFYMKKLYDLEKINLEDEDFINSLDSIKFSLADGALSSKVIFGSDFYYNVIDSVIKDPNSLNILINNTEIQAIEMVCSSN